jgi:hypothetical protein
MSGFSGYYVSLFNRPPDCYQKLSAAYPRLIIERDCSFAAVLYEPHYFPPKSEWLKVLSRDGQALFIAARDESGEFCYENWKNGQAVRALTYSDALGWHRVEGDLPDDWEYSFLFNERTLNDALARLDAADELKSQSESWLRQLWAGQSLTRHLHEPRISAAHLAGDVGQYMRVPAVRFDS